MRSEVHLRDGVAILLLVLMMVLVSLPVRRDNVSREPSSWHTKDKIEQAQKSTAS